MGSVVFQGRGMVSIPGYDRAWVELDGDARATVWTTLPAIGQGVATTFAQMAAADLGLDVAAVRVARADTAAGEGDGTGTFASRSAITGGGAIGVAARELRGRLLDAAAEHLEASAQDLDIAGGRVSVKGSPSRGVDVAELTAAANGDRARFRAEAVFDPPRTAYPYATHACVAEVDPETGETRLLRYVVVEDCGRRINPLVVDGQVHGAVAQGLGGTLYEAMVYDAEGQAVTGSLIDYLLPTAMEIPEIELGHLEIPAPDSPNGAKGVGEGGTLAPPAAVANAVAHALGTEVNELPLSPERVRAAALTGLGANVLRSTNDRSRVAQSEREPGH
jgi:carbon-monoxide dehydrogenase large subunit